MVAGFCGCSHFWTFLAYTASFRFSVLGSGVMELQGCLSSLGKMHGLGHWGRFTLDFGFLGVKSVDDLVGIQVAKSRYMV